jgi:hypothetical protein
VLLTGGGAIWVAWRQLRTLNSQLRAANDNERMRTSLKMLDEIRERVPFHDVLVSPYEAISWIAGIAKDPERLAEYHAASHASANNTPMDDERKANRARSYAYAIIAQNFFVILGDLVERNLVDKQFVLEKLSFLITDTFDNIGAMGNPPVTQMFSRLAAKARDYNN